MNIANLDGEKQYTFKIKAIGAASPNGKTQYISSDMSEAKQIYKLGSPQIQIVDNQYQWSTVIRASSYALYIDGELKYTATHETGKTYTYKPTFKELNKTYKVEVVAIGDEMATINSKGVEGKNVKMQQTKQLKTPDFKISYSHAAVNDDGVLTVEITEVSPYATGYVYKVGGVSEFKNATTYTKEGFSTPDTYRVAVYAQGGGFDEEGIYYVDSKEQGNNSLPAYNVTLLAAPTAGDMDFLQDGVFEFKAVNNAPYGYKVEICVNGVWQTVSEMTTSTTIDVRSYLTGATTVKFRVTANGNTEDNVIASKSVESKAWNVVQN